ncbi:MAG: hypothetical protein V3V08_16885 [Nannocystaceae bacterium]
MASRPLFTERVAPYAAMRKAALVVATLVSACATYSDRSMEARHSVEQGDLDGGVAGFNKLLKVDSADELPNDWKGDTALTVLERGMALHALGRYAPSARDFGAAEKELEVLDISGDVAGSIGKYIYSDSATKYKSPPTEKLALNAFNLLNYLARRDLAGARIEAKRFSVMRKYLNDYDPDHAHGVFGSYLAGFVYEKLGEYDAALRYYDEALAERDLQTLRAPLARLAPRTSYRTERLESYLAGAAPADQEEPPPEILVIVNIGRVPYKVPERMPIGAAVGVAHAHMTGDPSLLKYGAFKVVVYPGLVAAPTVFDEATVSVDGKQIPLELTTDLAAEVRREYDALKPKIIGAALTRMIARAAAAEGARAAGNQAGKGNGVVGLLAALAVEGTMVALDKPDTRSWTLLPGRVLIARVAVPPGAHRVEVALRGPGGAQQDTAVEVELDAKNYAVVNITTLR